MSNTTSLLDKYKSESLSLNQMANLKGGTQTMIEGKTACIDQVTTDLGSYCGADTGYHCHMDDGSYKFMRFLTATL